jgi:hypothetical protein
MRRILLTVSLTLLASLTYAQSDVERKIKEDVWENAPIEFKNIDVPEKWNNESAVILALQRQYIGDMATKMSGLNVNRVYVEKLNIHFRIKLLDKAAVENFSEISFDNKRIRTNLFGRSSSYSMIGIKVIKSNGAENEVDLANAVTTDAGSRKDKKIPIPNLEAGDILDYFLAIKDASLSMPNFGDEDLLEQKYPIVSNIITYQIPTEFNLYSNAFNNAPNFTKTFKDRDKIYEIKDEMRDKAPDLLWDFEYRTAPHIRYKISSDFSKPDTKTTAERILDSYAYNNSKIDYMVDFMEGNFKKEKDQRKIVYELCYLLNNPIYKKVYFNTEQGEPISPTYTPDLYFQLLNKYFTKYKIPHELMIVSNRHYGNFADLINLNTCDFMIKVNTTPPLYISRPSPFSIANEVPYIFDGMQAVTKSFSQTETARDKTLDVSKDEDNSTETRLSISLNTDDNTKLDIKRNVIAKGHSKDYHQYAVFTNYDYLKEYDQPKYQVESSHRLKELIKEYNTEKSKFEQRVVQDYNDRDTRLKDYLERELDVKIFDYKNLKVKSIGMWHTSPDTEYSDEFTVENISKKAGPNLILSVGHFIEKQTEVKEEDKKRTRDVYMVYPRSFFYEMSLNIPEGYTVEGLENLNKKIETDLGGFISSATIDESTLIIKTKKYYSVNYCKADQWPKIVTFLDAAVEFYNAKLLLKKK